MQTKKFQILLEDELKGYKAELEFDDHVNITRVKSEQEFWVAS